MNEMTDLGALSEVDFNNANYLVIVQPLPRTFKGQGIVLTHQGSLEEAIITAEDKFRMERGNISNNLFYRVQVQVGRKEIEVPEKYWRQYAGGCLS